MFGHQGILFGFRLGAGLAEGGPGIGLPAPEAFDGDLGVELEGIGPFAVAEGLVGIKRAAGQMHRAVRDGEGVEMRLRHVQRFGQEIAALGRGNDGVIAEFVHRVGIGPDLGPQHAGNLLRALAQAQQRNFLRHAGADPVGLGVQERVLVLFEHVERPAIDHRSRHIRAGGGQRIALEGAHEDRLEAVLDGKGRDPVIRRVIAMADKHDLAGHGALLARPRQV